jgi:hypothetical protein
LCTSKLDTSKTCAKEGVGHQLKLLAHHVTSSVVLNHAELSFGTCLLVNVDCPFWLWNNQNNIKEEVSNKR